MVLKNIFGQNCKFIFDGFSEFNEVDLSFLSVLSKSQIPTAIYFNYDLLRGPSFGTYESSIVYLFNIGFLHKNNDDLVFNNINTPEKDLDAKPSDYIRRWLFKNKKSDNYTKLQNVLNIYSFQDKKNEVDSIAKLIKYITSQSYNIQYKDQDKIKLKDICICTRKPQEYSSLFRESLIRNKIPNDISDRFNLSESTITTYLFKFLEQFNKQIRLNTFVETIKNDFFGLEHFDKSNIINLTECLIKIKARRIKIDSNLFQKEIIELQKYILKISSNKYLNEEKVNNYLKNAEIALNDLKFLSLNYPTFNETLNINEFKNGLISLIKILGIVNSLKSFKIENNYFENLSSFDTIFIDIEVEKNSRALNKFIEVLEEFSNVTKLNDENKLVNYKFKDLLKNFKNLIKSAKYQIRESIDYGVTVTSIEQTRGIPYKVIILCGAVDGIFPIPYLTDYFVGKDLKSSEERHRLSEQLLFYQFLSNGEDYFEKNKKIYITSFKYDDDRLQNRSFFTNELLKIVKPESEIDFTVSNTQIPDWYFAITDSNDSKYLDLNSTNIFKKFTLGDEVTTSLNRGLITNLNLLIEKLNNKTYSVSKLKNYLKCEFITFGNDFLDLKDNEFDFEDEILSNEKGNIIHRVMERFYITLLKEDIDVFSHPLLQRCFNSKVVKLNSNNLDKYLQLIKNLLNEVFIEYDKGNIYSTILLNQLKLVNDSNNEFNLIIKQDILDSSKYAILFNEFSLLGKHNSREVIFDNTKFNGKIDRI
ncbi:MAG: PD-(D/E)XK nuclease family protein, partial [Candidatus Kapabacteria bacterium]|nr:PD-(D/E)XK nuclease family protein [Candidatus Kapabacteria bacterium]